MRAPHLLAVVFAATTMIAPLGAQRPATDTSSARPAVTHVLRTREGSTLLGRVVEERGDSVHFQTSGTVLVIARSSIEELKLVVGGDLHDGVYWFADPNRTRLFFAPTGRMLLPREGYYSNTYLFLQTFVGGVSERVTMGGGMSLIPAGLDNQVFYLTPKVGLVNTPDFNLAAGALVAFAPMDDGHSAGILYGVATQGGPDGSVTAGLGWGYFDKELSGRPAVMLGGGKRVSRRMSLITENYLFPRSSNPLLSYGVRFFGEKLSTDLAMIYPVNSDVPFPGFPYVSFTVKF
jgi:hypothetical protein